MVYLGPVSSDLPPFIPSGWDLKYIGLANYIANEWSKDPSTKVGAVIVDEYYRPVSLGVNGLPQGIEDDFESLNNRELKYSRIIHGEINALLFAGRSLRGCTLYTIPFQPCSNCTSIMIQAGIKRIVAPLNTNERWTENFRIASADLATANVKLDLYTL